MSSELQGEPVDLRAVVDPPSQNILVRLTDAAVKGDEALAEIREEATRQLGARAVADAIGVIANFERMNRIADATGIPLDGAQRMLSGELRSELGFDEFDPGEKAASSHRFVHAVASKVAPAALRALTAALSVRRRFVKSRA